MRYAIKQNDNTKTWKLESKNFRLAFFPDNKKRPYELYFTENKKRELDLFAPFNEKYNFENLG